MCNVTHYCNVCHFTLVHLGHYLVHIRLLVSHPRLSPNFMQAGLPLPLSLPLYYETRIALSGRIFLACSSLSKTERCLRKIFRISGFEYLVSYKRNANLKELLAPSNPYKPNKLECECCYKCDASAVIVVKTFLIFGNSFRAAATGRIFLILKSLTCTSSNVVYLAECVLCGLQGVGSTANFKSRLANYKSHIKHKRRTCSITNHFIDVHEADHSSLKFMLIDQHHSEVLKSENFWIGMLLTNRKGLNGSHDFAQQ